MKIKRILALACFIWLWLLPVACKKDVEPVVTPPVATGAIEGEVALPVGSNLNVEDLSVVTSFGQFAISNNKFSIPEADLEHYRQVFVADAAGSVFLSAVQFPGQKEVKIDAGSTADALLMINPMMISIDNDSRKKLLETYQKHALYKKLVTQVSEAILSKKSPLDEDNTELIESINKIHKLDSKDGGRTLKTTGLYSDDDVFEKRIINENTLGLINKKSGITYMARVYDKNDKPLSDILDLGQLRTENTSILDLFGDTYTALTNFEACFNSSGSEEVPAFCNKFNQNVYPQERTFKFEHAGEYTVKVANPLAFGESGELAFQSGMQVLGFTIKDFLIMYDKSIAEKLIKSTCYTNAASKIAEGGLRKYFTSSDKDDVTKVIKKLNDLVLKVLSELTKCQNEQLSDQFINKRWVQFLDKAITFSKKIDIFSRVGAFVNLIHVGRGILFHKEYYEFCMKYDGSKLTFCEELAETIGAKNVTASAATLQGRINLLNNENIVRIGFLIGTDPDKMGTTAPLTRNVADIPGGLKTPYPYEMTFTFSGTEKIYYQAFAENQLGILHKGEIMDFVPEQIAESATVDAPVGKGIGDPHLTTFDGQNYSFMAVGEFIVSKSTTAGDRFEIQVRQQEIKSKNAQGVASFNTGIALHTGNDKICVYPDRKVYINDQLSQISAEDQALQNGGSIVATSDGSRLSIKTPNQDLIEIQFFTSGDLDYFIWPNLNRKGKVRGLQGNFDGNAGNDLMTSNGQAVSNSFEGLYKLFANSWRITQAGSLFTYASGASTATYTDLTFPKQPIVITTEQNAKARTVCENAGVTDPAMLAACIADVALTGDPDYANRTRKAELTKMFRSLQISNFRDFSSSLTLTDSKIVGSDWVPDEDRDGYVIPQDKFQVDNGFETEITFTLEDVYAGRPTLQLLGLSSSKNGPAFSLGIDSYGFNFLIGKLFYGEQGLDADLLDGKKHKLRIVSQQRKAGSGYECEIKLFFDGSSKFTSIMSYTQPMPFFSNAANVRLASRAITVHSWTLKSL